MKTELDRLFRDSAVRITATLTRVLGPARLDLAEEAVQDALVRALETWPLAGVPDNPGGWLFRVARNRALDLIRHDDTVREKLPLLVPPPGPDEPSLTDDELAMMFLCCHPGLPQVSQVALTLKTVGGLGVDEIAAALLTKPATVAQRLVRAKRWLREEDVAIEVPDPATLTSRVDSVLSVLYLLFTAGYDAVDGENAVRAELCGESIRLCRLLTADPRTDLPRVRALLALMLLQASRLAARTDGAGDLLLLSDQDRTRWNQTMIDEGLRVLAASCTGDERSSYHVEAAIAVHHLTEDTDWDQVIGLYDDLLAIKPSPVAAVNRAIAVGMSRGHEAGLAELTRLRIEPALRDYHLLPAALGALSLRVGETDQAARYYREALSMRCSAPARRFLETQLDRCGESAASAGYSGRRPPSTPQPPPVRASPNRRSWHTSPRPFGD